MPTAGPTMFRTRPRERDGGITTTYGATCCGLYARERFGFLGAQRPLVKAQVAPALVTRRDAKAGGQVAQAGYGRHLAQLEVLVVEHAVLGSHTAEHRLDPVEPRVALVARLEHRCAVENAGLADPAAHVAAP